MDDSAIQKGHRDATIVVEPRRKLVLWVCRGRGHVELPPFFEALGDAGRSRIQAAVMDTSQAFSERVRHQCPNAEIA